MSRALEFSDEQLEFVTTSDVIRTTFEIYGAIFVCCFLAFLVLRKQFPMTFTFNSVVHEHRTEISKDVHGHVRWISKVFKYTDEQIFENCGMSAVIYIRFLRMGMKIACVGIFNSIFLIPVSVYGCKDKTDACNSLADKLNEASVGNISAGNPSLLATVFAAYVIFGTAIHFIREEFHFFTEHRHKFLMKKRCDNYTVYVKHIPKEYRSDIALLEYFRSVFSREDVLEAKIALEIDNLDKKVKNRQHIVEKLERAYTFMEKRGYRPSHLNSIGNFIDSIDTYSKELQKLNKEIESTISQIDCAKTNETKKFLRDMVAATRKRVNISEISLSGESYSKVAKASRRLEVPDSDSESDLDDDTTTNPVTEAGMTTEENEFSTPYLSKARPGLLETVLSQEEEEATEESAYSPLCATKAGQRIGVLETVLSQEEEEAPRIALPKSVKSREDEESPKIGLLESVPSQEEYVPRKGVLETVQSQEEEDLNQNNVYATPEQMYEKTSMVEPLFQQAEGILSTKVQRRSLTSDTIETATLGLPDGTSLNDPNKVMEFSFSNAFSIGRSNRKHRKISTFDSLPLSIGSTKESLQKVGRTVTAVGANVRKNVGRHVGKVGVIGYKTAQKTFVQVKDLAVNSAYVATMAGSRMTQLILGSEDGKVLDSGFVTFTNLTAKNQCVQIIHHAEPFIFHVTDAPLPKDVIWDNVGLRHNEQLVSYVLAQAAAVGLCLVWTFPIAFFTSLSEAGSLTEVMPGLEKTIEKYPWIEGFLAQLSPVLLVSLTALLPVVIGVICKYEGHIATTDLKASLLTKLASFMVIQVFFVQAISGSIFQELGEMLNDPKKIVNLLAASVPTQVKSFIQFVLVNLFVGCSFELLRVVRVGMAIARSRLGPNLSEKERNTSYLFLKPISEPDEMEYPKVFSELILYFMVTLIYSCIAPIMSYFSLLTFGILSLVYRHQFVYIYNKENDSGGKLWSQMIMLLIVCMVISEMTLIGIVVIKKSVLAAFLLAPLLGVSILFYFYIQQQHFRVTKFLPSTLSKFEDLKNHGTLDRSFLQGKYLQPSLQVKTLLPDNKPEEIGEEKKQIDNSIHHVPTCNEMEIKDNGTITEMSEEIKEEADVVRNLQVNFNIEDRKILPLQDNSLSDDLSYDIEANAMNICEEDNQQKHDVNEEFLERVNFSEEGHNLHLADTILVMNTATTGESEEVLSQSSSIYSG